jgi:ubiquinone biosynthesis protein
MMGNVGDRDVQEFFDSFIALLNKDFDKLVDYYIRLGVTNGAPTTTAFRERFRQELRDLLEPYYGRTLKQINAADYINRVLRLAVDLHLRVPSELYLVNKVLLNLEGLLRQIDPGFDLLKVGKPYAVRRLAKQRSPTRWADSLKTCSSDYLEVVKHLPVQVRKILQKAVDDQMHLDMHITNLENFGHQMDKASNRVAFAVVTAAVIVGSSLILRADTTSGHAGGVSLLGLLGFTLAGTLGLWLLISILKGGRL